MSQFEIAGTGGIWDGFGRGVRGRNPSCCSQRKPTPGPILGAQSS